MGEVRGTGEFGWEDIVGDNADIVDTASGSWWCCRSYVSGGRHEKGDCGRGGGRLKRLLKAVAVAYEETWCDQLQPHDRSFAHGHERSVVVRRVIFSTNSDAREGTSQRYEIIQPLSIVDNLSFSCYVLSPIPILLLGTHNQISYWFNTGGVCNLLLFFPPTNKKPAVSYSSRTKDIHKHQLKLYHQFVLLLHITTKVRYYLLIIRTLSWLHHFP